MGAIGDAAAGAVESVASHTVGAVVVGGASSAGGGTCATVPGCWYGIGAHCTLELARGHVGC